MIIDYYYKYYRRLILEGVKFSIEEEHGLALVLVSVRESVVALGKVEAQHHESQGGDQLLLEGDFSQLRSLHST